MEELANIDWALIAPLIIIQFILMGIAIFDWATTDELNGPKWMWFCLIMFVQIIGPVLYFIFGKRQNE